MVSRPKLRLFRYLVPVIIVLAFIFSFRQCGMQEKPAGHPRDYAAIAKEGIIRVATEYNSISFYVDSDTVSGFHYELIQAFARDKGLKTEITPLPFSSTSKCWCNAKKLERMIHSISAPNWI